MRWQGKWELVALLTVGVCVGAADMGRAQFISHNDRTRAMLDGSWQSCRESDGQYGERVYDGKWPGLPPFELHMGPFHDFALFLGIQEGHREHNSPENLLKPHTVEPAGNRAHQTWNTAGLYLEVALAGGSREECESWYITLKRSATSSSSH